MTLTNGQWALAMEITRHVGPFLGLCFDELRLLEGFYSSSIRQQRLISSTDSPEFQHDFVPDNLLSTILGTLTESGILLPNDHCLAVNLYGLIQFYRLLVGDSGARKTTKQRLTKVDALDRALEDEVVRLGLPLVKLAVPVPELTPRPAIQVGTTQCVMDTLLKWRLIEASMGVALKHLHTLSEFTVFMRCVNMTLERNGTRVSEVFHRPCPLRA